MKPGPVWMNTKQISGQGTEERHMMLILHSSRPLLCFEFLVFIVMPEKLISHVVENGSSVEIALFARMGNSLAAVNQKQSKVRFDLNCGLLSVQLVPPAP